MVCPSSKPGYGSYPMARSAHAWPSASAWRAPSLVQLRRAVRRARALWTGAVVFALKRRSTWLRGAEEWGPGDGNGGGAALSSHMIRTNVRRAGRAGGGRSGRCGGDSPVRARIAAAELLPQRLVGRWRHADRPPCLDTQWRNAERNATRGGFLASWSLADKASWYIGSKTLGPGLLGLQQEKRLASFRA